MCVAYPAQVAALGADGTAIVTAHGRPVSVALLVIGDEPVAEGDWLLVHSGIALARLDEPDALERRRIIELTGNGS
jgi:hydrogenase expression/formation protein HypC